MIRLIYVSKTAKPLHESDVSQIIEASKRNNGPQAITGMLCFNRQQFLQCLEGPKANVEALYGRILNDPRHTEIHTLCYDDIEARLFPDWGMGYINLTEAAIHAILSKYKMEGNFAPRFLSQTEVANLMEDFSSYIANTVVVA